MRHPARGARNRTLYVRPEDEAAWEAAREAAWVRRVSLSEYVAQALRDKVNGEAVLTPK